MFTRAHHRSEHPALPVLDRVEAVSEPLPEDGVTAGPVGRSMAAYVRTNPTSLQDTAVVLRVDLERKHTIEEIIISIWRLFP